MGPGVTFKGLLAFAASACEALESLVTGPLESDLDQLGIMAHRFARSARLLAFSPARAAAAGHPLPGVGLFTSSQFCRFVTPVTNEPTLLLLMGLTWSWCAPAATCRHKQGGQRGRKAASSENTFI